MTRARPIARQLGELSTPLPMIEAVLADCHPRVAQRLGQLTIIRLSAARLREHRPGVTS